MVYLTISINTLGMTMNTTINLEKCKMMLDDLTRVTMTHLELLELRRIRNYTSEQLMAANDEMVNYVTPEKFNLDMARINNLQLVFGRQVLEYYRQLEMRQEVSRLIKLHEELYNDAANV